MKDKKQIILAYIVSGIIGSYALWFYPLVNYLGNDPSNELKMFDPWFYADIWCWIHFFTSVLVIFLLIGGEIQKKSISFLIGCRFLAGIALLFVFSEKLSVAIIFWIASVLIDLKFIKNMFKEGGAKSFFKTIAAFIFLVLVLYSIFYVYASLWESGVEDCYPIIKRRMKIYQSNYYSIPNSYVKGFYEIKGPKYFEDYDLSRSQYFVLAREECSVGPNFFAWALFWPKKMKRLFTEKELLIFLLENMRFEKDGESVVGISQASCKFLNKSFPEINFEEFRMLIGKSLEVVYFQDDDLVYEIPSKECDDICELE